ncbi:chemotaxis protein CheW [Eubacteriales bacterium OttesenSCG-928-K08]|nr:chemotaxis protein CheW [Eubacteriales bacterium OttesenSCG-928-K08]
METKEFNLGNLENETSNDMFLVFTIEQQNYAIEIEYVTEIIEVLPIVRVPNLPACLKGVVNIRGAVIPVMDARLRFGLEEREHDERTCIIVIESDNIALGLIVDSVKEVLTISEEDRMLPPTGLKNAQSRYTKGVGRMGEAITLLLDCGRLMDIAQE